MKNVRQVCSILVTFLLLACSGTVLSTEVDCETLGSKEHRVVCETQLVRKAFMQAYAEAYAIYTDASVPKKIRAEIKTSARVDMAMAASECFGSAQCQYAQYIHLRDYYRSLHSLSRKQN